MANDALRRLVKKNKDFTSANPKLEQSRVALADGGALPTAVDYTSDDPQAQVAANAQMPVDMAVANKIKSDYENRLTYEDAVKAARGDPEAQNKVIDKSLGTAMGSVHGLDMSEAARLGRAKEMGFDPGTTWYHGTKQGNTKKGIEEFNPGDSRDRNIAGFFTKNPEFANQFTKGEAFQPGESSEHYSSVLPVHLDTQSPFDYENPQHVADLAKYLKVQKGSGGVKRTVKELSTGNWEHMENPDVIEGIKALGFDSMHVKERGEKNIAVFEPSQIRSKFAEFDPSKKDSGKISYADGGDVQPNPIQSDTPDNTINYDQIQAQQSGVPSGPQGNVNVISPDNELVSVAPHVLQDALSTGYRVPTPEEESHHLKQQEFGTGEQQGITALEGAAEGASFGTSTGMERALGLSTPERIRARKEVNPGMHTLGEVGGLAASALIPYGGEANVMRAGGEALAAAAGMKAAGAGIVEQVGAKAIQGAFDMTLMQGGEEVSKAFAQDPQQTAETAIADIGLATVMGGVFGGATGAALNGLRRIAAPMVSELERPALEAGTFESSVNHSGLFKPAEKEGIIAGLGKAKSDAPEIKAAAQRIGAPVMEGMISDSNLVQKAEDALINGAPTYSGLKRQAMYKAGYDRANQVVDGVLGEGSSHSKAELGNLLKNGITYSLEEQNAPITAMYDALKAQHSVIPLAEDAGSALAKDLSEIQELKLSPSSPEGQLVRRTMSEVSNLKTVDDVKAYKSILNRSLSPTASSGEKRMAAIIGDKLNELEENGIESFAKKQGQPELMNLIGDRKAANAEYKQFIDRVKTLSEQLGKGRVHGVQDAIHFIQDKLTPEEITSRLFSKNNSQFLDFFQKNFPDQMNLMRDYQKGVVREAASKTGSLSPKLVFNQVNKLEPEVQKALFSPEELSKLADSETYLRAMPKNFNPSGTAHMDAMREFFNHPMGAAMSNARDMGIEKFIKLVSASPEVNQAVSLAKSAVKGEKAVKKGIRSIFSSEPPEKTEHATDSERSKLDKMVSQYIKNPEKLSSIGDNNPVPAFSESFAASSARAVQYLSSIRPDTAPKAPLDSRMPANDVQKAQYNRALTTAANPLSILNRIKDSTLTAQDVQTLTAIYPALYKKLTNNIQTGIQEHLESGKTIPYNTRLTLSTFLGQPLDSTLTPQGILGAQVQSTAQQQPQQGAPAQGGAPKKSTSSLSKLPQSYQTPNQSRAQRNQRQD